MLFSFLLVYIIYFNFFRYARAYVRKAGYAPDLQFNCLAFTVGCRLVHAYAVGQTGFRVDLFKPRLFYLNFKIILCIESKQDKEITKNKFKLF